jgi:hypothetical protein
VTKLGVLKKIEDLRSVWKHEERDFSTWLAQEENLSLLSSEVGLDIVLEERESSVGGFSVDILAYEEGTERKIIIENQIEDTNHDHLGKIITYAAGKDAEVIIWIVKRARDEHRQAIAWLNSHTDDNIAFFLIELELWQIGDSLPAPKFQVVAKPNDWAKAMKVEGQLTDTKQLQFKFWQSFVEYAAKTDFTRSFTLRKPRPQHWFNIGIGMSEAHITLTVNTQKKVIGAEIYIRDDKELFNSYYKKKDEIEAELDFPMDWQPIPDGKACRIISNYSGDIKNEGKWEECFQWLNDRAKKMKEVFIKYR